MHNQYLSRGIPEKTAYIVNFSDDWSVEQGLWWWILPVLVLARELDSCEMASHAGHGNIARAISLSKVEAEGVIFDVLVASIVLCRVRRRVYTQE